MMNDVITTTDNNFDDDLITWSIEIDNDDDDYEIDTNNRINNKEMIVDKHQNTSNKQQHPIIKNSIYGIEENNNLLQQGGGGLLLSSPTSMDNIIRSTSSNRINHHFTFPRNSSISSFINNKETTSDLKRLGSFYFSVASDRGSITDLLSLVDDTNNNNCYHSYQEENKSSKDKHDDENEIMATTTTTTTTTTTSSSTEQQQSPNNTSTTSLFHDILMNILTFVDFDSLGSFSEAGRRPNGECYYYIHLQLCKVISSCDSNNNNNTQLTTNNTIANTNKDNNKEKCYLPNWTLLRRYILMDETSAIEMIHKLYYDAPENQMKFRNNHHNQMIRNKLAAAAAAASSAAAFMLFMGTMMAYQNGHPDEYEEYVNAFTSLFKVMGVVGSIAAAKTMADNNHINTGTSSTSSSATAYDMQHSLWERLIEKMIPTNTDNTTPTGFSFGRQCKYAMMMAYSMATERLHQFQTSNNINRNKDNNNTSDGNDNNIISSDAALSPILFLTEDFPLLWTNSQRLDPYIHISDNTFEGMPPINTTTIPTQTQSSVENNDDDPKTHVETNATATTSSSTINNTNNQQTTSSSSLQKEESKKWYCGCIGAYRQLVHAVRLEITSIIKQDRVRKYQSLTEIENDLISTSFMDAIIRNDTDGVKELIHTIDIDICYSMNEDNTTMMYPLHAASFHGADKVLEFLCNGIDDNDDAMDHDDYNDGGLIGNINQQQELTGWTALHFAVGANNVNAVRILLHANVDPTIEADNGYTPFQWAQRLQHHNVVNEFKLFYSYQQQQQLNQLRTSAADAYRNNYFNRYR